MMNRLLKFLVMLPLLFGLAKVNGQVKIGAETVPQPFSVLELYAQYATDVYGGLRLPQLTTEQRNVITGLDDPDGYGLMIYNTTANCVEYWNSIKWVSLCLGTANITLAGDCNPETPFNANGMDLCTFIPADNPPCSEAYLVYLTAGAAYANLQVLDEYTAEFSLAFTPNNSSRPRTAVVRVVNNCSGEYKDFAFTQTGAICPTGVPAFSVLTTSNFLCGDNGAVIGYVNPPQSGTDYLWEYGGAIVHTGVYMQITYAGTYTVYAGLQGCETTPSQQIVITQSSGSSPGAPVVTATNGGVLCGSTGNVYLTANNVTYPVKWFHNGVLYSSSDNIIIVSGPDAAGEWFAVQQNGTCTSRMSNIARLQTGASMALPTPVATVNNQPLTGMPHPTVCKNGTLELKVTNYALYPTGTVYEWFINGNNIYVGVDPIIYAVSPDANSITISVQATNNASGCPATAISNPIEIDLTAPTSTTINNGAGNAAICGSTPATLMALDATGVSYEWFKNDVKITAPNTQNPSVNTKTYYATEPGNYTVRFKDTPGCWTQLSVPITVIQSAAISSLNWLIEPTTPVVKGTQPTYTVVASPLPETYTWTSSKDTIATITPVPPGQSASVKYIGTGATTIKVVVANACGAASIEKVITSGSGCSPITSGNVSITPNTTVNKQLDAAGNHSTPGDATVTFVAGAVGATAYEWYVDNIKQSETSNTYIYNVPTGSAGTHTIYAAAINDCTPSNTAKSIPVTVSTTKANQIDESGNYSLSGKVCYDVARTNYAAGNSCMPLTSRIDDFNNGTKLDFTYTFNYTAAYTDLTFEVTDPYVLLATPAITWTGNIATLHFNNAGNNLYSKVTGRVKAAALKITVIAKYEVGSVAKQVMMEVSVQDCACGCAVKTVGGGYLTFMCWNLGASEVVKTMTPDQQAAWTTPADNYGDWYQWGRQADGHQLRTSTTISTQASGANLNPTTGQPQGTHAGKFIAISALPYDWRSPKKDDLWTMNGRINDPCPSGWRMPTTAEFESIVNGGTSNTAYYDYTSTFSSGNVFSVSNTGTPGVKVSVNGVTRLFLPIAGLRNTNGTPGRTDGGYYWSSSVNGTDASSFHVYSTRVYPGYNSFRGYGFSVRCVAEQ